jgi:hypothetical protein
VTALLAMSAIITMSMFVVLVRLSAFTVSPVAIASAAPPAQPATKFLLAQVVLQDITFL